MRLIDADALIELMEKDAIDKMTFTEDVRYEGYLSAMIQVEDRIKSLPTIFPKTDEWCTDCKEYDQERHCCPRFNRVIRETVEEVKANFAPKTGRWIEPTREGCWSYDPKAYAECSVCGGKEFLGWKKAYCPNCGARMAEGEEG